MPSSPSLNDLDNVEPPVEPKAFPKYLSPHLPQRLRDNAPTKAPPPVHVTMPTARVHDNIEEEARANRDAEERPFPKHLPKAPPPQNSNRVCSYEAFCCLQARVDGMEEPRLISRDS